MGRVFFTAVAMLTGASALADVPKTDSDRVSECYGVYDALIGLGDKGGLNESEKTGYAVQRQKAESKAIVLLQTEGLNEELAREQLEGHALFMRSELRDLSQSAGIYSADDMRKLAGECNAVVE